MNTRKRLIFLNLMVLLVLVAAIPAGSFAQPGGPNFQVETISPDSSFDAAIDGKPVAAPNGDLVSVIVKLDFAPLAQYSGGIDGLTPTSPEATGAAALDAESGASQAYLAYANAQIDAFASALLRVAPDAQLTHRYTVVIGGASVILPASQVAALSKVQGVVQVYADRLEKMQTEVSPAFIGADTIWEALGGQESAGEGVVVGVLDSGIWPEHPSFSDPDPSGKAYAAPPATWHGTSCEFGSDNPDDPAFTCNNKLIGAERFMDTYDLFGPDLLPGEFVSARDDNGHGTHTSSTSAGNAGVAASIFGVDRGVISGIAPRAHVAMYKVCGDAGCYSSDSAAAVQQAVLDGVNAINFSISGGANPYADAVSLAFLDAYTAGVFVSASAGNAGPGADTTDHREPWVTTVAASTTDRAFVSTITLSASDGTTMTLTGTSITSGIITPTNVVMAADVDGLPDGDPNEGLCATAFPAGTFNGEIVVCKRGVAGRVQKGYNVLQGGAGGMILYNPVLADTESDNHFLPAVHLAVGTSLLNFMANHTGVQASFTDGMPEQAQGDVMAAFSSRGGPGQNLGISKPDVTAPGVQILAGHTPHSVDIATGPQGELFQAIAGTSMSSPHVAGAGALLKALHPNWTPGQIKSALMTTAKTDGVTKEDETTPANAFDYGSGRINLDFAGDPGLTFDASAQEYLDKATHLWDSNYPSLYVPTLAGKLTVQRTVHSLFSTRSFWTLSVDAPDDLTVTVPGSLWLAGGGSASFDISVDASMVPVGQTRMAMLTLTSGDYENHFPITIVRKDAVITLSKSCDPASINLGDSTECHITATNTTYSDAVVSISDYLPRQLQLDVASVNGAVAAGNDLMFVGSLYGAEPPDVDVVDATGDTPAGYLPLSGFGVAPVAGIGDETIANFNVPAFSFAGETWTRIGATSNGYAVVGGGTGADVQFQPQNLPDPTRPNNVLAPFWSDLNVAFGGALRAGILADGSMRWLVFDWENVANYGDKEPNSFQIWIGLNGVEDISFTYGDVTAGDADSGLGVGAENKFGNRGKSWFYDGAGTAVAADTELRVVSVPGQAGEAHNIHYTAIGAALGDWTNRAELTSAAIAGVATAVVTGEVTQAPPQPVTVELPLTADTWVNGGNVNTNYNDFAAIIARATGLDNAYFVFDRSLLPAGADVQSASLTLQLTGESGATGKALTAWNVNAFDPATVTYATAPLPYNPGSPTALPGSPAAVSLDVKTQVMAWDAAGAQQMAADSAALAVSASGPLGRAIFDSLESFQGHPAKLTVTYMP